MNKKNKILENRNMKFIRRDSRASNRNRRKRKDFTFMRLNAAKLQSYSCGKVTKLKKKKKHCIQF